MEYALAMSLDMYQRKLYVGVYRETYSGKKIYKKNDVSLYRRYFIDKINLSVNPLLRFKL